MFKGSSDLKDWITNLDANMVSYDGCSGFNVHEGFYAAYNQVASLMKAKISEAIKKYGSSKIYVSGHSLGASLGILAAIDIKKTYG